MKSGSDMLIYPLVHPQVFFSNIGFLISSLFIFLIHPVSQVSFSIKSLVAEKFSDCASVLLAFSVKFLTSIHLYQLIPIDTTIETFASQNVIGGIAVEID